MPLPRDEARCAKCGRTHEQCLQWDTSGREDQGLSRHHFVPQRFIGKLFQTEWRGKWVWLCRYPCHDNADQELVCAEGRKRGPLTLEEYIALINDYTGRQVHQLVRF